MQNKRIFMQTKSILSWTGCLVLLACGSIAAQEVNVSIEQATLKEGKVVVVQNGNTVPLKGTGILPNDIKVNTNGTFTVKAGKARPLKEGQVLDREGMLTSPDGTIVPVIDHVAMKAGKLMVFEGGEGRALDRDVVFPDGSRILTDGTLRSPNGGMKRLIDGELIKLDGQEMAARDSITLQEGKVVVQKDGGVVTLSPNQTIMMNDGSKVYADGTVERSDGSKVALTEGQIVTVEGVVKK